MPAIHCAATLARKEAGVPISTEFHRRSCWTDGYLLAHCDNYWVEDESGERVGIVAHVLCDEDGVEAEELVVRSLTGAAEIVVPVGQVIELRPGDERVVIPTQARALAHRVRLAGYVEHAPRVVGGC
jgi:hypothetical protein